MKTHLAYHLSFESMSQVRHTLLQAERDYFSKRSEREQLKMRLQLLRMQLVEQERQEQEGQGHTRSGFYLEYIAPFGVGTMAKP